MLSDDRLLGAMHAAGAFPLWRCPRATPLPGQRGVVERVAALARELGLVLPPFTVVWVERPREHTWRGDGAVAPPGTTVARSNGQVVQVFLDAALMPAELVDVVAHELQHVADVALRHLTDVERERRALTFAARVVARWCW